MSAVESKPMHKAAPMTKAEIRRAAKLLRMWADVLSGSNSVDGKWTDDGERAEYDEHIALSGKLRKMATTTEARK